MEEYAPNWMASLSERELEQVYHAKAYNDHFKSAGVPGHNHLLLIAKLMSMLDYYTGYSESNEKDQFSPRS